MIKKVCANCGTIKKQRKAKRTVTTDNKCTWCGKPSSNIVSFISAFTNGGCLWMRFHVSCYNQYYQTYPIKKWLLRWECKPQ